jgi:hypothetical protein
MSFVRLPACFRHYACQRSLQCCRHPLRAPCEPEDETRIAKLLASTEAGRAHLPILSGGFETLRDMRVFKHVGDSCVHLVGGPRERAGAPVPEVEPGCALQSIAGLDALAPACRNFPRSVARLPEADEASPADQAPEIEVLFLLACPTAARLLVADPSPFRFVAVPLDQWRYPPVRDVSGETLAAVRDLRTGWWSVLSERRDDSERLMAVLAALYRDPSSPPARLSPALTIPEALLRGPKGFEIGFVHDALERLPERGAHYAGLHWDLWHELTREITRRELHDALDIAPELLVALIDQLIPFAAMHDERPPHDWLRSVVRRTLAVARMADALLTRVPFAIDVLFADLIVGATHLDATGTPADA